MARLVFITGASSGIGQALAWRFHQKGYRLALAARRTEQIEAWAIASGINPGNYRVYRTDVSVIDSMLAAGRA